MNNLKLLLRFILFTILLVVIIQPANGQKLLKKLSDKAKRKVERKIEEKAEKKVDKTIDEGFNKVEKSIEKKGDDSNPDSDSSGNSGNVDMQNRMQGMLQNLGISGEPVPYNNNYSFNYLIQMHFESYDKEGSKTSTGEFITHLNPDSKSMAYEVVSGDMAKPGQGMFIIDTENSAMIILNSEKGGKTGMVYGIGSFFQSMGTVYEKEEVDLSETPETYLANPNVKKTGRTKTIAGLKCKEYIYNDESTESEIWITKDMKMDTQDYFSTLFKTSMYSHGMGWGYMMEAKSLDKDTGNKSIMRISKVDKNSNVNFNMEEYQITNLGSFQLPTESDE